MVRCLADKRDLKVARSANSSSKGLTCIFLIWNTFIGSLAECIGHIYAGESHLTHGKLWVENVGLR